MSKSDSAVLRDCAMAGAPNGAPVPFLSILPYPITQSRGTEAIILANPNLCSLSGFMPKCGYIGYRNHSV